MILANVWLLGNIFAQLFWSSFGLFSLVFSRRKLSVPFVTQIDYKKAFLILEANLEAYLEPCQISKMKIFAKIMNLVAFMLINTAILLINNGKNNYWAILLFFFLC